MGAQTAKLAFVWIVVGILVSCAMAIMAWRRSGAPAGYFDGDVYGMTPAVHRRYALAFAGLAVLHALAFVIPALPAIPLLAVTIAMAVFYAASFLRGAEADE